MQKLHIDIETYSELDLTKVGAHAYAHHPNFELLLFGYSIDGDQPVVIDLAQGEKIPDDIVRALDDPAVLKTAYNAAFEITCLSAAGLPAKPEQWACTQVLALYAGLPAGLARVGAALELPSDAVKDRAGWSLIRYFCNPVTPTISNGQRTRNLPQHDPDKWALFKDYNRQDVIAEIAIENELAGIELPATEKELWAIDQRINERGIPIDRELVEGAVAIREQTAADAMEEAREITGLANPNSRDQLKEWLEKQLGEELPNLRAETVEKLSETTDDQAIKRVLEIRQSLSKASIAKYDAFIRSASADNRIHGAHQFIGASRTGRWAGRLIQPQNLPRNYIQALSLARELVKAKKPETLRLIYGSVSEPLSQILRTVIVPSEGRQLIISDYSAIEARIIAWLAGEKWVMEEFEGEGKIYEATAARMFGVDKALITRGRPEYDLRQRGKVATLALGYQGSIGALKAMGALNIGLTESELPEIVGRWRRANPNIVRLWQETEQVATFAVDELTRRKPRMLWIEADDGTRVYIYGLITRRGLPYLVVKLPSGRCLHYFKPAIEQTSRGTKITYEETTSRGSMRTSTYGGKLTENIVQAIARDCLAESIRKLDRQGYEIIMHVHDEVVIDGKPGETLEQVTEILSERMPWAPGLNLTAAGFTAEFYQKD